MKAKRIISLISAFLLCLTLFSCAGGTAPDENTLKLLVDDTTDAVSTRVPNVDGEIGGSGAKAILDDSLWAVKPAGEAVYDAEYAKDGEGGGVYGTIVYPEVIMFPPVEPGIPSGGDQTVYRSGVLTAGEWRDNKNWNDWLSKIKAPEWAKIADSWGLSVKNRIAVRVLNGTDPVKSARVELLDSAGKTIWSAVSDHEGYAYLFAASVGNNPNYPNGIVASSIKVSATGAASVSTPYSGKESLEVQIAAGKPVKKLDLMFVVDTTGSMADELEYLKAELEDVVTRAAASSGAAVRTSVNFYRDEGDEYVVRYFGFKDDISEAVSNIRAQRAEGGGDYPEAVHTALFNAVYEHAWDEGDSVKLMFLLLDAPPHDTDTVKESLRGTVEKAAAMGIRIIPVMSSGTDTTCEVLFRSIAALTGGTYVFLTDHSGVGGTHAEQSVGEFTVEKLNDLMVRVITEYCS